MFKANHFKKYDRNSFLNNPNKINQGANNIDKAVKIYTIRDKIYKIIPQEYFEGNFKIRKEHLCLGRFEIELLNRDVKFYIYQIILLIIFLNS